MSDLSLIKENPGSSAMDFMRCLAMFCLPLAFAASIVAQTRVVTSPPGWGPFEGEAHADRFGQYSDARYQFADGEFKGRAMALAQVGYRLDWTWYDSASGMGRTWTRVTLHVSDCDFLNLGKTWTANSKGTPTNVFQGKITWPTVTGRPSTASAGPVPFVSALAFPFASPWSYNGKRDLLLDYEFRGGTLANGYSRWTNNLSRYYWLDSAFLTIVNGSSSFKVTPLRSTCKDSGQASVGRVDITFRTYGSNTGSATTSNMMEFYTNGYSTAKNAPVVHVVGLQANAPPVTLPSWCGSIWVDFMGPTILIRGTTDSLGRFSTLSTPGSRYFYFIPSLVGKNLWAQIAWQDSATRQMMIGQGTKHIIPPQPAPLPRRRMQFSFWIQKQTGEGFEFTYWHNPIAQYTFK